MKKRIAAFLVCIILLASVTGCGTQSSQLLNEAEKADFSDLSVSPITPDNYGAVSYEYLQYIQENYPGRIPGSEKERDMAIFLLSELLGGGYTKKDINISTFAIDGNSAPVQDIPPEKAFSGGNISNESQNIEVTKQGASDKIIIVGAHYDSVGTHGVDDNGSGVAAVLESAIRLVHENTPYTIRFVFFGSEEIGMYGSRAYVDSLSEREKENIVLMINIDSILAGDFHYIYGGTVGEGGTVYNTKAVEEAFKIAEKSGLDIHLQSKDNSVYPYPTGQRRSDHTPFADLGIPYIYFEANNWTSLTPTETEEFGLIMHTEKDDLSFIESSYGSRGKDALRCYSLLLDSLLKNDFI